MNKISLLPVFMFLLFLPVAGAIIEEDWGNYTRADTDDGSGNTATLSWLRRSYSNANENYTITLKNFDSEGSIALDVNFKGRSETVILRGEWDANRTNIILTGPVELFNRTMIITPLRIVPPAGVFTCCPEAEININVLRPVLKLEFNTDTRSITSEYNVVNPFANWSSDSWRIDPFDNSTKTSSVTINLRPDDSYRMYEKIPIEITVTNEGEAEITSTVVYIDADGLIFEDGKPYYQLPTLVGTEQKDRTGETGQIMKLRLKFPSTPKKLNYTIQAYVKGVNGNTVYYNNAFKTVFLLPSVSVRKSVTEESMLLSRKDVETAYPGINSDNIFRWLAGGEVFVSLGVTNYQNYEIKGVKLNDALSRQFTNEDISLNWTFDLKPYESKEFKYKLKATRPGKFNLPPALLTYSELNVSWNLLSGTPATEVHGPCIQVFKRPDKPVLAKGENTTVTLTVRNSGDMPSKVKVIDALPENTTFLGGRMYYEGSLSPKESAEISYDISMNEYGQTLLPEPRIYVNGIDNMGCGEPLFSKILVKEPSTPVPDKTIVPSSETPMQTPIPLPNQYSLLEGVLPAFMLVLAVAVLLILHRSSK